MTRSAWFAGAATALVAAGAFLVWSRGSPTGIALQCARCNVLLVTIDTLRVDRIGAYGSARGLTPVLDALAARGVRFDTVYSPAPLTLPAHTSLFTATEPPAHGVRDNGIFRFDGRLPTLATMLHDQGYATGAFVGSFVLDSRFGLAVGFDEYDDRWRTGSGRTAGARMAERPAEDVVGRARTWIGTLHERSQPWFAWVHLYDPHAPYEPPAAFLGTREPYDGEVAYADASLGVLLASFPRDGRTLVVVTADHGESLGEHGEDTHGVFAYDSTLRVPLVIAAHTAATATTASSTVFSRPARLIDVAPTILHAIGLDAPATVTGRSLLPDLARGEETGRPAYFEAWHASLTRGWAPLSGIVHDGLKFIDLPIPELYDLANDPTEQHDLHRTRQVDIQRLQALLDQTRRQLTALGVPSALEILDRQTREALGSLGYTTGRAPARAGLPTEADDPKRRMPLARRVDRAMERFESGQRAASIEELRDLAEAHGDDAYIVGTLASVLRTSGRLSDALDVLGRAVDRVPDPSLRVQLSQDLADAGRLDEAIDGLERLVQQHADYLDARLALGVIYARAGQLDAAKRSLEQVVATDPTAGDALDNLGVLALGAGRADEAETWFRRAVEADAGSVSARMNLAFLYARTNRREEAIALWRGVLADDPAHPDTLFNLGLALADAGQAAEARPLFERFLRVSSPDRQAEARTRARRWLDRLAQPPSE